MKIKNIAAICKKNKYAVIYERYGESGGVIQYIGDGAAAYPVTGLPKLDIQRIKARNLYAFEFRLNNGRTLFAGDRATAIRRTPKSQRWRIEDRKRLRISRLHRKENR